MTEEEKTKWFMLGKKQGQEDIRAALRAMLNLNDCPHCKHTESEHD
jgi:hypothetical protein